jgi:hypothetical protein
MQMIKSVTHILNQDLWFMICLSDDSIKVDPVHVIRAQIGSLLKIIHLPTDRLR